MRLSLHILAVVLCAVISVTSAGEHSYLANLRTVYHGHGATSYQNVQIDNEKSVPLHGKHEIVHADAEQLSDNSHGDRVALVIPIPTEYVHEQYKLLDKVVYKKVKLDHEKPRVHGVPEYYNLYEGEHEYEYYQ